MIRSLAALAALPVAVLLAAPANADPDSDYLNMLSGDGFATADPTIAQDLLVAGHNICRNLGNGSSPADESAKLSRMSGGRWTTQQTGSVVAAAQSKLCPGTIGS